MSDRWITTLEVAERLDVTPGTVRRLLRQRELRKTIGSPYIFRVAEKWFRVEAAHFTADLAIVAGRVKSLDFANAADTLLKIRPERLHVVSDRRDRAQTSDDDSSIRIH